MLKALCGLLNTMWKKVLYLADVAITARPWLFVGMTVRWEFLEHPGATNHLIEVVHGIGLRE